MFLRNTSSANANWSDGIFALLGAFGGSTFATAIKDFISEYWPVAMGAAAHARERFYDVATSWSWIAALFGAIALIGGLIVNTVVFVLSLLYNGGIGLAAAAKDFAHQNFNLDGMAWTTIWNMMVLMGAVAFITWVMGLAAAVYWRYELRSHAAADDDRSGAKGAVRQRRKPRRRPAGTGAPATAA